MFTSTMSLRTVMEISLAKAAAHLSRTDGGNIDISCSEFSNNAGIGLTVDMLPGNTLTLNDVSFGGNTTGDIDLYDGTLVVNPFDCGKKEIAHH